MILGSKLTLNYETRVLVIASPDDRLGVLASKLNAEGWSVAVVPDIALAVLAIESASVDAVLVDLDQIEVPQDVVLLRQAATGRYLPILAIGGGLCAVAEGLVDLRLSESPHPAQLGLRLEQLVRAAVAEEEFLLRAETMASYGVSLDLPKEEHNPVTVLAVGSADHRFLALSNSLCKAGVQVVAAPTPYTAFDYLHERTFDATILWGGENRQVAMSIASGMKRNTRLYHIPIMLYLQRGDDVNLNELYMRGFADVAGAEISEDETAERIMALAFNHRRRIAIRRALDSVRVSELTDPVTGLFGSEPFAMHLGRVYAASMVRKRKLSLCVLKVVRTDTLNAINRGGWLEKALPQVGAMISRLVRVEDTAACLSPETYALMMPAANAESARLAAERIAAVIACTAFEAGEGRSPFVIEFDIGVAEMRDGEGPIQLLERAVADARHKVAA